MTLWLDTHLSPALARWITRSFGHSCVHVRDLGLARATDREIFDAARGVARAIVTKDRDFAELVARLGPPPSVILLTVGNTSTERLSVVLSSALREALELVERGEPIIEIGTV